MATPTISENGRRCPRRPPQARPSPSKAGGLGLRPRTCDGHGTNARKAYKFHALACWSASRTPSGSGFDRIWLWFRDHWGVVWALRNQERFNRTAELAGWPVRLSWYGLEPVDGVENGSELPVPIEAEPAFRGLLRRFAQAERLDQVSEPARARFPDHDAWSSD